MRKNCYLSLTLLFALFYPLNVAALDFETCEISDSNGKASMEAECATLSVPENYAEPNGTKIEIFIAKIKSMSKDPEPDPFTMLAGGPGQSATESFIGIRGAFEKIRKRRDIYLIDQRGTGHSNKMQCVPDEADFVDMFVYNSDEVLAQMKKCLANLPGDPRFYHTSIAVKDLDRVREELGVEQWNLLGISYGTRVAQHYLRRYPERSRTVVLDAVVPASLNLGPDIALESQRAINQMTTRCSQDEACAAQFPELDQKIQQLVTSLKAQAQEVRFENFATGEVETIDFGLAHLAITMRMSLYSAHGVAILPSMLHSAYANENFGPLARQALNVSDTLSSALSLGMHNSVICNEDARFVTEASLDKEALDATYMGSESYQAIADMCSVWPTDVIDSDFKEIVVSDQPVLVLSGSIDPITPPAYGEMVLPGLKNSLHIVNPEQGHMQSGTGCMPTVIAKFIEQGSVTDLDYSCMQRQTPEPFFINANGPKP